MCGVVVQRDPPTRLQMFSLRAPLMRGPAACCDPRLPACSLLEGSAPVVAPSFPPVTFCCAFSFARFFSPAAHCAGIALERALYPHNETPVTCWA